MPAVHVDDLTVLPRLAAPGLGDTVRPVQSVTTAPRGFEGEGFPVRRAFAGVDLSLLDPFVHDDPTDRPPAVFGGKVTLHFDKKPFLLLPVIS